MLEMTGHPFLLQLRATFKDDTYLYMYARNDCLSFVLSVVIVVTFVTVVIIILVTVSRIRYLSEP